MRGVEFFAFIISGIVVVLGASVVPYVFLFVLRKRQRTGCGSAVMAILIGAVLGGLLAALLYPSVVALLVVPRIQDAVDAQCGVGAVTVQAAEFSADPFYAWISADGSCHYLDAEQTWECYCPADGAVAQ